MPRGVEGPKSSVLAVIDSLGLDEEQAELLRIEKALAKKRSVTLKGFVEQAWSTLEPESALSWNWHLDTICAALEASERGEILNGILNVPPGTMKSMLAVMFRAWLWSKNPGLRFLSASYGFHLSIRDNVKLRVLITSPWYQGLFPHVKLAGDQNAKERFDTTAGGWSVATSVGGPGTGEHPHYIFIDDPLTAQQAMSTADRASANHWVERTLSTRGTVLDARTWLIMQRLHEDDTTGFLLGKGGWWHLYLPMRFQTTTHNADGTVKYKPHPLDQRTVGGELLWPDLFTEARVRKQEIALGPYGTAGQLQQQPAPEGGGLFKREWFKLVDAVPAGARRVRGWDTAGTEDDGDWTRGVKMAEKNNIFYVEDVVGGQLSPHGVDQLMRMTAELDGVACAQREEKEGGASGLAVVASRAKLLLGYDYACVPISGDKRIRANPYRAQVEAGNVYLVRGPWNVSYLEELSVFPVGKHDDQVDGSSCAFNALVAEMPDSGDLTW